jgi:hypothetical protein
MNLPNEVPFQAWLHLGRRCDQELRQGQDAAKIPDLNIWDPARDMMNEVKKAERKGDVKAIAELLPKIAAAIPKARSQVSEYQEQMEGSAQTGVDAGRFVEDTRPRRSARSPRRKAARPARSPRSPPRRACSRASSSSPSG